MRPMRTPQLARLLAVAGTFTVVALVTGRVEALKLAAPAAGAFVWRVARRPGTAATALRLSVHRCLEGDDVTVDVEVAVAGGVDEVALAVVLDRRLEVVSGSATALVAPGPGGTAHVEFVVRAKRWGVLSIGPVRAVAHDAGHVVAAALPDSSVEVLRVLPTDELYRSRTALPLPRPLVGAHIARRAKDGIEYAESRPYQPGDALRHVDWKTTARRGSLMVAERYPERTTELVLFLDTFVDAGPDGMTTLDIGVRAAIAIARHHLPAMDRVGVVGFGGSIRWLPAGAGRRHFPRLVDHVIGSEELRTFAYRTVEMLPPALLPPNALVVALTPLIDDRAVVALTTLARRGHGVVVVDTFPPGYTPHIEGPMADVAIQIWRMERDASIRSIAESGAPVVPWSTGGGLDAVLAAVQQRLVRAPRPPR
jgi:uncharacterized protein (DUF58 family)